MLYEFDLEDDIRCVIQRTEEWSNAAGKGTRFSPSLYLPTLEGSLRIVNEELCRNVASNLKTHDTHVSTSGVVEAP